MKHCAIVPYSHVLEGKYSEDMAELTQNDLQSSACRGQLGLHTLQNRFLAG